MVYIAKAKPVRVRLKSGDREHATYESLLENFCVKDLLPLISNGMLSSWLSKHGRTEEAKKVDDFKINGEDIQFEQYMEFVKIFFDIPEMETMEELYKYWTNSENYKNNAKFVEIDKGKINISLFLEEYKNNKQKHTTEEWLKKFYDIKRKEKSLGENFQTAYKEVQNDLLIKYRTDKASLSEEEWTKLFNLCDLNEFKVISSNFAVNTKELGYALRVELKASLDKYVDENVPIDFEHLIGLAKTILEKDFCVYLCEIINGSYIDEKTTYDRDGYRSRIPIFPNYPYSDKSKYDSWTASWKNFFNDLEEGYKPREFPTTGDVTSTARFEISRQSENIEPRTIHLAKNITVKYDGYYYPNNNSNNYVRVGNDYKLYREYLRHIWEIFF
ncbi:MAG: hypothetical protein MJZ33_07630 [Paludibacteraceae bacterium]|nr:hypothetical protein [Paludibacteraceae bacterium]